MSLITSAKSGGTAIGIKAYLLVTLGFCLIPAIFGFGLRLLLRTTTGPVSEGGYEGVGFASLLAYSPLLTLPCWALLALCGWRLLQHGQYGALTAFLLGSAIAGSVMLWFRFRFGTSLDQTLLLILLGGTLATLHRLALALRTPEAF